jgi:hypothetical protein
MASGTRPTGATLKPVPRAQPVGAPSRACTVCEERLSAYNPGPNCYAHTVGMPWKGPNNRP